MKTEIFERDGNVSLIDIWCECFGDPPEVPTEFYSTVKADILVARDGESIVGVVNILPVTLGKYTGGYVYAAGVKKAFRGRGIFDEMLKETDNFLTAKGASFVCLVPGDESLARTYIKRGYTEKIERFDPKNEAADVSGAIVSEKDFADFATPECEREYCFDAVCPYGLLKPLTKEMKVPSGLSFAWYMGEA